MDGDVARRDRAHADGALGVERREFIEGAVCLEHVALGADLAGLAERAAGEQAVLGRRSGTRQTPADAALLEDDRRRVGRDDALRDGRILRDEGGGLLVRHLGELEVGGEFVGRADGGLFGRHGRGQHGEGAEVRAAREQEGALRRRVAGLAQALEERVAFARTSVFGRVLESDARLRDVAVGLGADPGTGQGRGDLDPSRGVAGFQGDVAPGFPPAVAPGVDLQREGRRGFAVMSKEDRALREAREQERIGGDAGLDWFVGPDAAAADGRTELIGRVERGEPEIGLRLAGACERALGGPLVEELGLGGVIAAEDEASLPRSEVADDLQVGGARREAGGLLRREVRGEFPEEPVHGHQTRACFADVTDARPLGVPAMRAVVRVAALGQAIARPLAVFHDHQDDGAEIPADGPERVLRRIGIAGQAAGSGDFGELVAADERPVAFAVEGAERAARDRRIDERLGAALTIIREDDETLSGIETFTVIAGQRRGEGGRADLGGLAGLRLVHDLPDEALHRERADIDLVEAVFHRGEVDLVRRVGQVAGVAGQAAGHELRRDDADRAVRPDEVRPDDELVRFLVDHAVGRRAADAFRAHDLPQVRGDLVELVARAVGEVRSVGDDPEAVGPRDHGAGAALALVIEIGELGIDAGPFLRRGRGGRCQHGQGERGKRAERRRGHGVTFRAHPRVARSG